MSSQTSSEVPESAAATSDAGPTNAGSVKLPAQKEQSDDLSGQHAPESSASDKPTSLFAPSTTAKPEDTGTTGTTGDDPATESAA